MEFALVAIPFFYILFATIDLGRYFLTQHSLRTVTSEAARAAIVNCYRQSACTLPAGQLQAVEAAAPFLAPANLVLNIAQANGNNGTTVTVTGQYPFTFVLPIWRGINGISDSTAVTY